MFHRAIFIEMFPQAKAERLTRWLQGSLSQSRNEQSKSHTYFMSLAKLDMLLLSPMKVYTTNFSSDSQEASLMSIYD